jgi:uncharacterized membrane protein YvbJ
MICSNCGKENHDDDWVCGHCGETLRASSQSYADPDLRGVGQPLPGHAPKKGQASGGKTVFIIAVMAMMLALIAIPTWYVVSQKPDANSPTGTMESYVSAVSDKDCDKLYSLISRDSLPANSASAVDNCSQFLSILNFEVSDFNAIDEEINGDTATVTFEATLTIGSQSVTSKETATLVMEDGVWKVDTGLGAI